MRMLVYCMCVRVRCTFYIYLHSSVISTTHTNNTYQSLMLHWQYNNYSYLTKYGISDFGAQLPPLSFIPFFILISLLFIIHYSRMHARARARES